ncbi:hypothetical protein DPMN_072673 [Dreissena polymorpha]|uniref:Uncharacterized protein n=1 Tax=Dreissena polymorpha TaxID=45954 RepID=A0A9D4BXQ4_DREPO|nr:hypothetical protein DPMN_072673 [Dreissena polymorpha]
MCKIQKHTDHESVAVEKNAKRADKNRDGADIPGDEYRLRLHLNRTRVLRLY